MGLLWLLGSNIKTQPHPPFSIVPVSVPSSTATTHCDTFIKLRNHNQPSQIFEMWPIVRQFIGIGGLFQFLSFGNTIFFPGSLEVVGASAASFSAGVLYEFFGESERAEMEEESWEVLANAVPASLALAIKRQDPL